VSFALQENFGYSIAEAVYLGCVPILPNRLVYPELYIEEYLYNTFDEACNMVSEIIYNEFEPPMVVRDFQESIQRWFR